MIREHDIDCGQAYAAERAELVALVAAASPEAQARSVPATPDWSVLDVVGHVVGLAADLNAGRFPAPGEDPNGWTARQVERRRGRSIDELAAEWAHEGPTFEDGLRALGYEVGAHFLADLLQHRADVGHALGSPGLPAGDALTAGVDWYLDVAHHRLLDAGRGGVAVVVEGERVELGPPPVLATVTVGPFEAFRALGGRRTVAELAALGWSGDPSPILEVLPAYPPPATSLAERT